MRPRNIVPPSKELLNALERLVVEEPIDPLAMGITIRDPERLAEKFGGALAFFGATEQAVEPQYAPAMLGIRPDNKILAQSLPAWADQERAHGVFWGKVNEQAGISPLEPKRKFTGHFPLQRFIRLASTVIPPVADIIEWEISARGSFNEWLTAEGYRTLAEKCRKLGENDFADGLIVIAKQEGMHHTFYLRFREHKEAEMRARHSEARTKVRNLLTRVPLLADMFSDPEGEAPWSLKGARSLYNLGIVGEPEFGLESAGLMMVELTDGHPEVFAKKAQPKIDEIFGEPGNTDFVRYVQRATWPILSQRAA